MTAIFFFSAVSYLSPPFFSATENYIKLDKMYDALDSRQYRMPIVERRETDMINPIIVLAFCLESLS